MHFELATAARIIFGTGTAAQLPDLTRRFGERPLLVTGRDSSRMARIRQTFEDAGFECIVYAVPGEPTVSLVRQGARISTASERDVVVAIGGGSAIDAAKAIAILAENSGEPLDYLEVVGKGEALQRRGLPFIAVPTTAGTGAEVTRNAVLGSPEHGIKASLRSPMMLAQVALIDPDLTLQLPPAITAQTGLDALTQLIEAYVCRNANPLIDALCESGLARVPVALPRCFKNGGDISAREDMSYASLMGGLALSNAGLGVVHGFAGPAGGMLNAPHGAICAALLVAGVRANLTALRSRGAHHPSLAKYGRAAQILTGRPNAQPEDLGPWLSDFVAGLGMQSLGELGLKQEQIPELVRKAAKASSMKANPIVLEEAELKLVVEASLPL